jgi:hypothetical protein
MVTLEETGGADQRKNTACENFTGDAGSHYRFAFLLCRFANEVH